MRTFKLMALATLATATVASNAQVVDFEDLVNDGTEGYTLYGSNVDSGGYNFASTVPYGDDAILSWTPDTFGFYTGSIAILANYGDDGLLMTASVDGAAVPVSLLSTVSVRS